MAIKGGDLIHAGNTVLLERAQTAGPGQVNLNPEKVYELGNYQSIATIYDIPDLSFSLESIDASAALEALLIGEDFDTMIDTFEIDLTTALPLDVVGQIKPGKKATSPYDVVGSIAAPYLTLESLSYRFGLRDKAAQTATLRGDSIFYNPGAAIVQEEVGTNAANQLVVFDEPAYAFNGDVTTGVRYALAVCLGSGHRLVKDVDYSEAVTDPLDIANPTLTSATQAALDGGSFATNGTKYYKITAINANGETLPSNERFATVAASTDSVTLVWPAVVGATGYKVYRGTAAGAENRLITTTGVVLTYKDLGAAGAVATLPTDNTTGGTYTKEVTLTIFAAVAVSDLIRVVYATDSTVSYPQLSHTAASAVRPAAIRGRDIKVYIGGQTTGYKWSNIQSVTADWKVNLEKDEEFGSAVYTSQDYEVPDVSGTIVVRPNNAADLFSKIKTVANLSTSTEVAGALTTTPLELLIVLHSPEDGSVLKTIKVPDARITIPGYSGTVQQKLDWTFNFDSDGGLMYVYKGLPFGVSGL